MRDLMHVQTSGNSAAIASAAARARRSRQSRRPLRWSRARSRCGSGSMKSPAPLRFISASSASHAIVRILQRHLLVQFQMLLHVQSPSKILHADLVHIEIVAGRHGADAVENVLCPAGAGNRVHHHVGIGQHAVNAPRSPLPRPGLISGRSRCAPAPIERSAK